MHTIRLVLPFFIFLFLFLTPVLSLTILDTDINDATISEDNPTTNYAIVALPIVSFTGSKNNYIYVMFNISSLPTAATIVNAYVSLYQYNNGGTGTRYILAYNTSNNWTQANITWDDQPLIGTLQSNTSIDSAEINVSKNFTITNALQAAVSGNAGVISIMLKDNNLNSTIGHWMYFSSKEFAPKIKPLLYLTYNVSDCFNDCGDCGCKLNSTECYIPPIIGSYCDYSTLSRGSIKTVFNTSCTGTTYLDCPEGTTCNQITPQANVTTLLPDTTDCSKCWFINYKDIWGIWHPFLSNCFPLSDAYIAQCDCNSQYCSPHIYSTNLSDVNFSVNVWTAGCFNPSTGTWVNITDETGGSSSFDNITDKFCPNCVIDYNRTSCQNTTTLCYDSSCNQVQCSKIISSSTCSSNYGGSIALQIGGLMGITDCSMSMWVLSMLLFKVRMDYRSPNKESKCNNVHR